MPTDPLHGPQNVHLSDGVTLTYQYSFDGDLSERSNVQVSVYDDVNADGSDLVEGDDFTVNEQARTITLETAQPAGTYIHIFRFTDRDRHIDWQPGSTMPDSEIDEDANRLTAVTQEIEGLLQDCLRKNAAGTAWNARGLEGKNAAAATEPNSWVTYTQLQAAIEGGVAIDITEATPIVWRGDGVATDFAITGFRDILNVQTFVYVAGVYQTLEPLAEAYQVITEDDTAYPGAAGGPAYIRFNEPPVDDAVVEIRVIRGTAVGFFDEGSVTGDMIGAGEIDESHMNFGSGDSRRILSVGPNGNVTVRQATHADINDFDAGVRENRLDQMAIPSANLDMGLQQIRQLGTGTAALHAVNKAQMESYIDTRILAERVVIGDASTVGSEDPMPTAASTTFTHIATFEFTPDLVHFAIKFRDGSGLGPEGSNFDFALNYTIEFSGANRRSIAAPKYINGVQGPTLEFERDGVELSVRIVELGSHLQAWTQGRAIAIKYGDAA